MCQAQQVLHPPTSSPTTHVLLRLGFRVPFGASIEHQHIAREHALMSESLRRVNEGYDALCMVSTT